MDPCEQTSLPSSEPTASATSCRLPHKWRGDCIGQNLALTKFIVHFFLLLLTAISLSGQRNRAGAYPWIQEQHGTALNESEGPRVSTCNVHTHATIKAIFTIDLNHNWCTWPYIEALVQYFSVNTGKITPFECTVRPIQSITGSTLTLFLQHFLHIQRCSLAHMNEKCI